MKITDVATTSLVLALISMGGSELLGPLTSAIIGVIGSIVGSIALIKIRKQEDKKGKYKAIFAVFIGATWILIGASILLPLLRTV